MAPEGVESVGWRPWFYFLNYFLIPISPVNQENWSHLIFHFDDGQCLLQNSIAGTCDGAQLPSERGSTRMGMAESCRGDGGFQRLVGA